MKLFIQRDGRILNLLDEDNPLEQVLPPPVEIGRFSNVQTRPGTTDWFICDVPGMEPVGPFRTRKEALQVEERLAMEYLRSGY